MTMLRPTGTPAETPTQAAPVRRRSLTDAIPLRLALGMAALWVASIVVVYSIAPAPIADPTATAIAVGVAFDLAILSTLIGFAVLQRWGLLASAAGGVVFLVGAGLCSLGGHTGGWLVAQYVTGGAILAVSQAAFRRF